ncbi:hypothetical protein RUM43_012265 [Polyplax serrata]|uniref:Serrate RNA effector molecule homolog n=1 Tax=Polyplax serrata TaxID=468196 RepID=A0AAN8PTK7_POLSC
MGDSDDEYDRKRRDKFRGERTESYSRESRRGSSGDGRRDDWSERESPLGGGRQVSRSARGEYRDYRGGSTRERYSPAPPVKRYKADGWDDRRYMGADYAPYSGPWAHEYGASERSYANSHNREPASSGGLETQPAMMSFKAFLQSQDDTITDEEAMAKYNEYKLEFKRQQLNEFFVAHKDEEWFKIKYHPEESVKRKEEQLTALKNRVAIFNEFLEKGLIDSVRLDGDQSEALIKLMDCVVVRLEGGDEADLKALDTPEPAPAPQNKAKESEPVQEEKPFVLEESDDEKEKKKDEEDKPIEPMQLDIDQEQVELQNQAKEFSKQNAQDEAPAEEEQPAVEEKRKRKREYDFVSGSDSEEEKPVKNDLDEPPPPGEEADKSGNEGEDKKKADSDSDGEGENEQKEKQDSEGDKGEKPDGKELTKDGKEEQDGDLVEVENNRRDLHKTSSIFLRNLAPTITKTEVVGMCKRYPGFLRVALAEPQAERRWFRRGWVTFERHVNIKEICWNLNNIRLRDCELGAIVNKDLTRRVRTVNGITSHKNVVRHDIKIAAKMMHTLDARNNLWTEPNENGVEGGGNAQTFGLVSNNPVLRNITDYLIEEASAEEEELLGTTDAEDGQIEDTCTIERDDALIKVLDRLLLYLRIVYSVDYYNHCEYPQEDEMPNRCGLIHARGLAPTTKVSQQEIQDYCKQFETKISTLVTTNQVVTPAELTKLGAKDPEKEVEKFIQANTQELSKDKWLCPLSGKKFKGPDFVRKHIQNKHAEKVQEVVKEVEYFNNYLMDPKRPQLAEHPGNKPPVRREPEPFNPPAQGPPAYAAAHYAPYGYPPRGGFYGYSVRGMRGAFRGRGGPPAQEFRQIIHYRDLDAPREVEEFI